MRLELNELDSINMKYINDRLRNNPKEELVVALPNTTSLSVNKLKLMDSRVKFHIIGGRTSKYITARGGMKAVFASGATMEESYITSNTFSVNELIKVMEEIEKLESGLSSNWKDDKKVAYFYYKLKSNIMYDPLYEKKSSKEVRSLRGLLNKKTVCAGYAMILKELCDRQGIDCQYVEGNVGKTGGGHAWNIINLDGKLIPFDLTWDSNAYFRGEFGNTEYFGLNNDEFIKNHIPLSCEPIQDYKKELSSLDRGYVKRLFSGFVRENSYYSTTYTGKRKDGTEYYLSQIGTRSQNGVDYYRYLYADIINNKLENYSVLVSETNVAELVDAISFNRPYPKKYEEYIDNVLFSKANINDSIRKGTGYISSALKLKNKEEKDQALIEEHSNPTKVLKRNDGSEIIVQQMKRNPEEVAGRKVMQYDILEVIVENNRRFTKRNTVFTETNLLKDNPNIQNNLLSRKRLDRKTIESGGYIGYLNQDNQVSSNRVLLNYYSIDNKNDKKTNLLSFAELKRYALKYEVKIDDNYKNLNIIDKETGKKVEDSLIKGNALFANIWVTSAGVYHMYGEEVSGIEYAFNDQAKEVYNYIVKKINDSLKSTGNIDTLNIFLESDILGYKHSKEIIINLFSSEEQTNLLDKYFRNRIDSLDKTMDTKPLYNYNYVGNLINNHTKNK